MLSGWMNAPIHLSVCAVQLCLPGDRSEWPKEPLMSLYQTLFQWAACSMRQIPSKLKPLAVLSAYDTEGLGQHVLNERTSKLGRQVGR